MRYLHQYLSRGMAIAFTIAAIADLSFGAILSPRLVNEAPTSATNLTVQNPTSPPTNKTTTNATSPGDFPICTETNSPFTPFCLPRNGEEMIVDATYYVTWNADFYPLNATITIELRYPNSSQGDSAYTSEKTDNSYGYIPLHMRKEWLQGKKHNLLTLYIIELESRSDRRAGVRQGPTVILHPRPTEHYKPSPPLAFNKLALFIGLPVSLAVVVGIVAGLYFGMRDKRKIGVGSVMGSRGKGYAAGKSRDERLNRVGETTFRDSQELSTLRKSSDDIADSEGKDLERTSSRAFTHELLRLKSWSA